MDNKKNNKIEITMITVMILILILGLTYAYFMISKSINFGEITAGTINMEFVEGTDVIKLDKAIPIYDEDIDTMAHQIKFSIENTGSLKMYTEIYIKGITISESLKTQDFRYRLEECDSSYENSNIVKDGSFSSIYSDGNLYILENVEIDDTKYYVLKIWVEETGLDQGELNGASFKGTVAATGYSRKISIPLARQIISNEIVMTKEPEFTETSEDRGLFKLKSDIALNADGKIDKDIYYYRGSTENDTIRPDYKMNNYVSFGTHPKDVRNAVYYQNTGSVKTVATMGSPIIWRVVRINEDGSVELIDENNIGGGYLDQGQHTWNSKGKSDYINEDGTDSNIKQTLETWYSDTFINPTEECVECQKNKALVKLIQDTKFCNDRSESNKGVVNRLNSNNNHVPQPTLKCDNINDRITAKIGLISADEMIYSGALYKKIVNKNTTYLGNGASFWTMSPAASGSAGSDIFSFYRSSYLDNPYADNGISVGARPVITISSYALVTEGDGSLENPYKIK